MIKKNKTKHIISIIIMLFIVFIFNNKEKDIVESQINELENLYKSKTYGKLITIEARVEKLLRDDIEGDKHQKIILNAGKMTILLAHNIDVAPRIPVKEDDIITVKGEYEWNPKGGVIHWTHKKDNNQYGWVILNNKKYQ